MTLSAVVVDDSIIFRKAVRDSLEAVGGVRVVGVAGNGLVAVEKIRQLKPDLVTLDVEMPDMDGLQVLKQLQKDQLSTKIIMISSLTQRGASATTEALSLGAFDFILKPNGGDAKRNLSELQQQLSVRVREISRIAVRPVALLPSRPESNLFKAVKPAKSSAVFQPNLGKRELPEVVLIGISTGGPQALRGMLTQLPADFPVPVIVVQHMPPMFTASMARDIDKAAPLNVVEAADAMPIRTGTIYIAPGGKQLGLSGAPYDLRADVNDDPAQRNCKPSVDYLFKSAIRVLGGNVLGLIMTGMGDDGLDGCRGLQAAGAAIWAQDEASCTVYGMPRQIVENGLADEVIPLGKIASKLANASYRRPVVQTLASRS